MTMETFLGGRSFGKSQRAKQLQELLLDAGAAVTRDEVMNGCHFYALTFGTQTFLFVEREKA